LITPPAVTARIRAIIRRHEQTKRPPHDLRFTELRRVRHCAAGPAHDQRPVHTPGRENGIDVPDGGLEGIVRRTLRFLAASPLVVGDVPPPRPQFSDDPPPVPLSGELAIEVDHRDTGTAGVGDGQGRIVNRHHAGPLRTDRGSAVLRHVFRLVALGVLYDFFRPCTWVAGPWGWTTASSATTDRISIAVGPAG
jgi:hypothetical protein